MTAVAVRSLPSGSLPGTSARRSCQDVSGPASYTVPSVYSTSVSAPCPPAVVIAYLFRPNILIFQVSVDCWEGEAMTLLCHPPPTPPPVTSQ